MLRFRRAVTAAAFLLLGSADAQADARTITLIHLNDLHAHLVPHRDRVRVVDEVTEEPRAVEEERGGIARLATLIQRVRESNPNSLLMNVGDTYHGGVEALYTRGNALVPAVNALGIDVGVPGNWDFAYGPLVMRLRYGAEPPGLARFIDGLMSDEPVERAGFPNLAANLTQTFPPFSSGDPLLPATLLLRTGGVSVGFIGLTSDIVPRMARPFAWGFDFVQGEDAYRELIDDAAQGLRAQGANVVVVLSELGLHKDRRLADVVRPGIAVFFSAHTHELTPVPLRGASGALVVEAGNDGWLGRMDLSVRDGEVVAHRWELLAVDATLPEDPHVKTLVAEARAPFLAPDVDMDLAMPGVHLPLKRPIDTVIGKSPTALHRRGVLENPFNRLLSETIRRATGAQISMTPGLRFDAVLREGEMVTLEHAYRYLPMAPTLSVGEIRGDALRRILEDELTRVLSPDPFLHSGGWFGGFAGIEIELDRSRPDGERVIALRRLPSGEPIGPDDVLRVASCVRPFDGDGVMCGSAGFEAVAPVENSATGNAWTPLELIVDAFERGQAADAVDATSRVHDAAQVAIWPVDRFVQPLKSP
jgi:sulfur-oxidizing protein SoxB